MKNEVELLCSYIHNVLYQPEQAALDIGALGETLRPLGESVEQLGRWAMETARYAGSVAQGVPSQAPAADNVLAANVCAVEQRLRRMTGQVEELVHQNDGARRPDAAVYDFDDMVCELRKRTSALENERNLFVQFTESASERIIVLDEQTGEMVFANRVARDFFERHRDHIDDAGAINRKSGCSYQNSYSEWVHTVSHPNGVGGETTEYYQVHSLYIHWENRGAIAHMFSNITELRATQELARRDALTGALNRGCAMEQLDRLYAADKAFSLAFVDVDYLKYCNDTFGHAAGDRYLRRVVELLQQTRGQSILCRTGGDEFMVISESQSGEELRSNMEELRRQLCREYFDDSKRVHKSFSYGIAAHTVGAKETLAALLSAADERMYQNKLENKKNNHMLFRDDRL